MSDKIHALMILEIIGKPQKYLVETLESLINQMGIELGVVIKSKSIKEPKLMEGKAGVANAAEKEVKIEEHNDFYLSFAEIEVETDNILTLAMLIFKYMPAHIEIISPENIPLSNVSMNDFLNNLIMKLYGYDEVARVLQVEKAILENKLKALSETNDKEKPKTKKKKKN